MNKYDDIIHLNRPKSNRPSMSIEARAAQFAPFSALVGYEESIKETSRITNEKHVLSQSKIDNINDKLNEIKSNNIKRIKITYFIKDKKKSGGEYSTKEISIKKIDDYNKKIITNYEVISFEDIFEIEDISNL